ncbi:MAG: CBS domain-containing protein [Betaproteobacteria bacterium]|nr:MAG: CBS domain-containing protein [Betaproteobacteria bacterium]
MLEKYGQLERRLAGEQQTFAQPLRALVQRAAVTCTQDRTLAEVAALMRQEGVGSVVVLDARSRPVGIVTSHDMVGVVAASAAAAPVAQAMSREPVSLPAHALAYEAAVTMLARRIRHVLVMDEGRLAGVVSERDLFSLQRLGLGEITMELRLAGEIPVLAGLAAEFRKLTRRLVEQGVAPEQLTLFVSVLNDRLSQRAIEIVRKRHQLERISWCWLAFGSEGRFEQTLATDQDNGLMFTAHDGATPEQVRARLLPFAREVNEALDACGFPLCKGNVMASNPELCLSLDEWRAKMTGWIEVSLPKALLDAAICFDFRALYGDAPLVVALRDWVSGRVKSHPAFLRHMAEAALQARPALNRFGSFASEDAPGAPETINLKLQGARIFVDAARIYALAKGLPQTSTAERLRGAFSAGTAEVASAVEAFYLIQRLRLEAQLPGPGSGDATVNRVAPGGLDRVTQAALKEALRVARELQSRLALDYQL